METYWGWDKGRLTSVAATTTHLTTIWQMKVDLLLNLNVNNLQMTMTMMMVSIFFEQNQPQSIDARTPLTQHRKNVNDILPVGTCHLGHGALSV